MNSIPAVIDRVKVVDVNGYNKDEGARLGVPIKM